MIDTQTSRTLLNVPRIAELIYCLSCSLDRLIANKQNMQLLIKKENNFSMGGDQLVNTKEQIMWKKLYTSHMCCKKASLVDVNIATKNMQDCEVNQPSQI